MKRRSIVYENFIGYLKNHWTKHRHVCTCFNAFSMLIPHMDMKCNISDIFENLWKIWGVESTRHPPWTAWRELYFTSVSNNLIYKIFKSLIIIFSLSSPVGIALWIVLKLLVACRYQKKWIGCDELYKLITCSEIFISTFTRYCINLYVETIDS